MKRITLMSILLIAAISAMYSQEGEFEYYKNKDIKTLLADGKPAGKFGAITLGYSIIGDKQALILGQKYTWLAGHSIGIGMGLKEFINEYHHETSIDKDVFLAGGYGGLSIEAIVLPRFPVHLSFPVLMGAGGITYSLKGIDFDTNAFDGLKAFLIIEPAAELEINLTKSFRLATGVSYRFTTPFDVNVPDAYDINVHVLNTFTYSITFKFGKF